MNVCHKESRKWLDFISEILLQIKVAAQESEVFLRWTTEDDLLRACKNGLLEQIDLLIDKRVNVL